MATTNCSTKSGAQSNTIPTQGREELVSLKIGYQHLLMNKETALELFKVLSRTKIFEKSGFGDSVVITESSQSLAIETITAKEIQMGLTNAMLTDQQ